MTGTARRRPAVALLFAALGVLCLAGAVVAFALPMNVRTRLIEGVTIPCGSLLDPIAAPYYCDDAQSGRIGMVIGLFVLAIVFGTVSYVVSAADRPGAWQAVCWGAWPVTYLVTVVSAWVVTYPYVLTRESISGLEYLLQLLVSTPLGWVATSSWASTPGQDTVVLLLAGLIQVALVAALCRWGLVRSRRRAEDVREHPSTAAPVT